MMIMGHTIALIMLIAVDFLGVSSAGLNIQYSGTVVTLTNNTEVTAAVVRVDGVPVFSSPSIITVKKREIVWQSMRQHVEGHLRDLQFFSSLVMKDFHHTEVSVQSVFACDGDDGYMKISYDNISITFHCKNEAWTPSNDQAAAFMDTDYARNGKNILHDECSYWDKQRKVPPTASVFQEEESSPEVVCHATGFFPKTVKITWQKDGEDVHEDVDLRETLPNQDGSFQKRSILTVSAEDLQKHTYTCVIQHSSLEKEMVLNVSERRILNPGGGSGGGWIVVVVALAVLIVVGGGIVYWKKNNSDLTPVPDSDSERPSEVTSDLLVRGVTTASLPTQIRSKSVIKIFNVYNKLTTKLTK